MPEQRYRAQLDSAPADTPAEGFRTPYGWPAFAIVPGKRTRLVFPDPPPGPALLRLGVALDIREPVLMHVADDAGNLLATLDLRYACVNQIYGCPLPHPPEAIHLSLAGDTTTARFLFGPGSPGGFSPHLVVPGDEKRAAFHARMDSLDVAAQFGWMEGCVLDGLLDLGLHRTLDQHLDLYFPGNAMVCEDFRSRPSDNAFHSIETMNMLAALAIRRPDHPAIDLGLSFWDQQTDAQGCIDHGSQTVAEGNLTVAYPLAVIARQRGREDLAQRAALQLRLRRDRLVAEGAVHLRRRSRDGLLTFRNWGRGVAWYLLGMVRTLRALDGMTGLDDLHAEVTRAIAAVLPHQREDGLWCAFLEETASGPETSGSAGIAAAIAIASRQGWTDGEALQAARRAQHGLDAHLTPDGYLDGMTQSNKAEGAEDLQRSGYRVIGQPAMGMYAQLLAAV